jgi:hypothetical protein
LEDAFAAGFKYDNELKLAHKDGAFIDINMNIAAVKDANGAYVRTICMIEEVTQRLRR